ncbi:16S rRNA (guanine(966)-N(2))-methyltransferase RsmD [Wenzhouxiangella marina]|nr:16S rRNA (guanine(966)-N(2))-methyltransferase RsmD [Wenzhouxiangella marina]MBB6086227.1 16S rRNA (guanine966-N2)-methyltransferase [Wenzhouxiangella marina]
MTGRIRIISGQWRGRRLSVADLPGLRPTPDRARETLFNWIGPAIHGKRCLDLFAGTGALGLEAASRGASEVILVEKSAQAVRHLESQLLDWPGRECLSIVNAEALSWLAALADVRPFDLVFIDPPYHQGLQHLALRALVEQGCLASGTRIYLEAATDEDWRGEDADWIERHFECLKERRVGAVMIGLFAPRAL